MLEPKLRQDEPMDTGEIPCGGNYEEEGEIQTDDDEEVFWTEDKYVGPKILDSSISYGLPPSSIQELKKLSRARRFGIPIEHGRTALVDTGIMTHLYKSLGIDEHNEKHYRFNAVHMRGTQNMSTGDVYDYFTLFNPSYIEWINDVSCNIIWTDHFSAAKALLHLSKEIKNLDEIRFNGNPFKKELELNTKDMVLSVDEDAVDAREIKGAIPPGFWRIGVPTKKSPTILLRLATRSDKKQRFAEKNSEYYKKYGNPHFGNIPGIVSNSMRNEVLKNYRQRLYNSNRYTEDKNRKNPWGSLAEEWGKQDGDIDARSKIKWAREGPPVKTDLRLSLNNKHADMPKKKNGSDFGSSQSANDNAKGKFPKMKMYADEEVKLGISTVTSKKIIPQANVPYVEDLRMRINRSRKRKQMIEEDFKRKRMRYWSRLSHKKSGDNREEEDDLHHFDNDVGHIETRVTMEGVKEFDGVINYNDPDNDDSDDDDDDDDDDDVDFDIDIDVDDDEDDEDKGSSWALENYSDLRQTLVQGKKRSKPSGAEKPEKSKSNAEDKDGDEENDEDDIYNTDITHRSPLQIEFENDDYFEKESL